MLQLINGLKNYGFVLASHHENVSVDQSELLLLFCGMNLGKKTDVTVYFMNCYLNVYIYEVIIIIYTKFFFIHTPASTDASMWCNQDIYRHFKEKQYLQYVVCAGYTSFIYCSPQQVGILHVE